MSLTLQDFGERKIAAEILTRFAPGIGNDCAHLSLGNLILVATTDPVPEAAAKLLGNDPDLYWVGWLLVTINASDLAAAGAAPVAFLAALEAPPSLNVKDFERLLLGISESCKKQGLCYSGGNVREGGKVAGVGTAIGICGSGRNLCRSGAREGDLIVSVGQGGIFWRDVFQWRLLGKLPEKNLSPLFRPLSQIVVMNRLAEEGLVCAAIDNSDGLLPTLRQLASASGVGIEIDTLKLQVPKVELSILEPARLWLGWGDWNVLVAIRRQNLERAERIAEACDSTLILIGQAIEGSNEVFLRRGVKRQIAPRLESERFSKDSWFQEGISQYIELIQSARIP